MLGFVTRIYTCTSVRYVTGNEHTRLRHTSIVHKFKAPSTRRATSVPRYSVTPLRHLYAKQWVVQYRQSGLPAPIPLVRTPSLTLSLLQSFEYPAYLVHDFLSRIAIQGVIEISSESFVTWLCDLQRKKRKVCWKAQVEHSIRSHGVEQWSALQSVAVGSLRVCTHS